VAGKPGRRWGELRGEYAEVRQLAGTLRDIADSRGVTLRMLEARMAYGHSAISQSLSGSKRPAWDFITAFLAACAGNDGHARAVLERRVRPLWEAAAPGRARRAADLMPRPAVSAELHSWVAALRDAADAQQMVANVQLSVGRYQVLAGGLLEMLSRLAKATETLTAERDALSSQLREHIGIARELSETRARLNSTQQRLDAAERLQAETSQRLEQALRQLEEAERLKYDAMSQAASARKRLAELEQYAITAPVDPAGQVSPREDFADGLMGGTDQEAAEEILRRVDDALDEEAANLDELRSEVSRTRLAGPPSDGLSADNSSTSPGNAGRYLSSAYATGQAAWVTNPTGRIAEDWPEGVQPEGSAQAQRRWREGIASAAPFDMGYHVRTGTGSYRYFEITAVPISQDGRILEWSVTSMDVTSLWQAGQYQVAQADPDSADLDAPPAISSQPGQVKSSLADAGPDRAHQPGNAHAAPRNGQIVTFYSFKGGTGRTMALANVAWILAANGLRVLVSDWHLEAPGLHRFFQPFLEPSVTEQPGIIDFIRKWEWKAHHADIEPEALHTPSEKSRKAAEEELSRLIHGYIDEMERYAIPLTWAFPGQGALHLWTSGKQTNGAYQTALSTLDWDNFYDHLYGGPFFDALRQYVKSSYDYVLIDSATGLNDIASICTVHLPDIVVDCFTLSTQSLEGAADIARMIEAHKREITILPVPMRVDRRESIKNNNGRMIARRLFGHLPADMLETDRNKYWEASEVPYRVSYPYNDTLAVFDDQQENPASLLAAFERITGYITEGAVTRLPRINDSERRRAKLLFKNQDISGH
jgi:Mrp family chromosome partitioning ATPase/PAS domain-containing protein